MKKLGRIFLATAIFFIFNSSQIRAEEQGGDGGDGIDCDKILEVVENLPPITLDSPTIGEGILDLWARMQELGPVLEHLNSLEDALAAEQRSPNEVFVEAQQVQQALVNEVANRIDVPLDRQSRRELEGYRAMINKARRLQTRAAEKQQEQERQQEEQQQGKGQKGDEEQDQQEDHHEQEGDQSEQQDEGKESDHSQESNSQNQKESKQRKSSGQKQGKQGQQGQSGEQQGQEGQQGQQESKTSKSIKDLIEKIKDFFKKKKPNEDSRDQKDQQQGEGEDGESKSKNKKSDQKQKSKQKGKGKGKGQGEEGEQEGEEQGEDSEQESDGTIAGKSDKVKPPKVNDSIEDYKYKASKEKGDKKAEDDLNRPPATPPDEIQRVQILKKVMDDLWIKTLRNYTDSESFLKGLLAYSAVCDYLVNTHRTYDFLAQYAARAYKLTKSLQGLQVDYSDLNQLGQVIHARHNSDYQDASIRVNFLLRIFNDLKTATNFTSEEAKTYQALQRLLAGTGDSDDGASVEGFGKAFWRQLTGPLSRAYLRKNFPGRSSEGVDWSQIVERLRVGGLLDFVFMDKIKDKLKFMFHKTVKPRTSITLTGHKVPLNEHEPTVERAEDIAGWKKFFRNGPPEYDLLRLISEDLLQWTYRNPVVQRNPTQLKPKVVTIILYDLSSSMTSEHKNFLRQLFLLTYADLAEGESLRGEASHIIYAAGFDDKVREPERVEGSQQMLSFFERQRENPLNDSGGTRIADAIIKAYEWIADHQQKKGELTHANILVLTDGEDSIRMSDVLEAREKVDPKIEIMLNAVSLANENSDLKELSELNHSGGDSLGRVSYRSMDRNEIAEVINQKLAMEMLERVGQLESKGNHSFSVNDVVNLKQALAGLESARRLETQTASHVARFLDSLKNVNERLVGDDPLDTLFNEFVVVAESPLPNQWSPEEKARLVVTFLETVAKEYKCRTEDVLSVLSADQRTYLTEWIGSNVKK